LGLPWISVQSNSLRKRGGRKKTKRGGKGGGDTEKKEGKRVRKRKSFSAKLRIKKKGQMIEPEGRESSWSVKKSRRMVKVSDKLIQKLGEQGGASWKKKKKKKKNFGGRVIHSKRGWDFGKGEEKG